LSLQFRGEPLTYTRFSLAQNMEGENSHVEMKLSDGDEEVGNSVGEHHDPRIVKSRRSPRSACCMIIVVLLIFLIGFMIGYLAERRRTGDQTCSQAQYSPAESSDDETPVEPQPPLDWNDLKNLLTTKITTQTFETQIKDFKSNSHEAGSEGDEKLASTAFNKFKSYGMNPWIDEHFIKVQTLHSTKSNKVTIGDTEIYTSQKGYLSYSATGTVKGSLVYAYQGRPEDFKVLMEKNINLTGSVVLVRAGQLSFAEQVANAEKVKAAAVLIYPDRKEYRNLPTNTELFGHVHLGSGDPYTPGFPSFNHTQFPPATSSGLPGILAQTITADAAKKLFTNLSGDLAPTEWSGSMDVIYRLNSASDLVQVEVNNVLVEKSIHNIFGVIKGLVDPDRYVVIGAQRDSWGPGFAKSTVGTTLLMELARAITEMKNDGYMPRRSLVFASWSAGDFGSVGATEWQEAGFMSMLHLKAAAYINLDRVVLGSDKFQASASPLLYSLIGSTLNSVKAPGSSSSGTIYSTSGSEYWESSLMVPMKMDDAAYSFLSFSGIPSFSFGFIQTIQPYQYLGTAEDTQDKLYVVTNGQISIRAVAAAQVAGQMALRLTHDHLLRLDVDRYTKSLGAVIYKLRQRKSQLQASANLTLNWMASAHGDFSRAARDLMTDIQNSDLNDVAMCRLINNRIMEVEHNFLSPYVSPKEYPFRHIFFGSGEHTLQALIDHLNLLLTNPKGFNSDLLRNQFALATWTIQGSANALSGDVWEIDNEV
ncbi:TFR1 protein, partial [Amia calva]|nr:TFR1 protein [Amia calva]